ncbi:MAG: hypothetical protein ABMB14_13325 [Myxococcota bacterium]
MRQVSVVMQRFPLVLLALGGSGCATPAGGENPRDWYDPGSPYDVSEVVAFTDVPYDFTGDVPIADLPVPGDFQTIFDPADQPANGDCADWVTNNGLPAEITGIVTLLPRYYFKTSGCVPDQTVDSDEKFYGSYFIQDATGGQFVLGDSKVTHFDMGDRVTLKVRALKESFDQTMIQVHDVVEIQRGPEPVYYEEVGGELGPEHVSRTVRVSGVVATEASTFGEVYLDGVGGVRYKVGVDQELARRGVSWPVGTALEVTGPVLYSFNEYTVLVLKVGQVTEL